MIDALMGFLMGLFVSFLFGSIKNDIKRMDADMLEIEEKLKKEKEGDLKRK